MRLRFDEEVKLRGENAGNEAEMETESRCFTCLVKGPRSVGTP
jgi:hypothetical protein